MGMLINNSAHEVMRGETNVVMFRQARRLGCVPVSRSISQVTSQLSVLAALRNMYMDIK